MGAGLSETSHRILGNDYVVNNSCVSSIENAKANEEWQVYLDVHAGVHVLAQVQLVVGILGQQVSNLLIVNLDVGGADEELRGKRINLSILTKFAYWAC